MSAGTLRSSRQPTMAAAMAAVSVSLVVLVSACPVAGQPAVPPAPGRPGTPGVPSAPDRPVDPGAAVHQLSLVLLGVNARGRTVDGLMLDVAGSLVAVGGRRDVRPLSLALVEALRGRELSAGARDRIATSVVDALGSRELEQALREVTAALAAAGLGAPDLVVVQTELRRLRGSRR